MKSQSLLAILLVAAAALAQEQGPTQSGTSSQTAPTTSSPGAQKKPRADATMNQVFSEEIVDALLSRLRQGLTRRNPKLLLSAFDAASFPDYPGFAERMNAQLDQYDSFRSFYRISSASEHDGTGIAQVEFTIERSSRNSGSVPLRTRGQATFTFARSAKGWRIVDLRPPDLLTQ
jgi:hypothetical protein